MITEHTASRKKVDKRRAMVGRDCTTRCAQLPSSRLMRRVEALGEVSGKGGERRRKVRKHADRTV